MWRLNDQHPLDHLVKPVLTTFVEFADGHMNDRNKRDSQRFLKLSREI